MVGQWSLDGLVSACGAVAFCVGFLACSSGTIAAAVPGVEVVPFSGGPGGPEAVLPDGRWFRAYAADKPGEAGEQRMQQAVGRHSSDEGLTWSEPEFLFDLPPTQGQWHGFGTLFDRDGILHLFGVDLVDWSWDTFEGTCTTAYAQSSDGGKTWTPIRYLDCGHSYAMPIGLLEHSSGRLLVSIVYAAAPGTRKFEVVVMLSDDGGESWRPSQEITRPGKSVDEAVIVELQDGRVWMLSRPGEEAYVLQCFSSDGGETWSPPEASQFVSADAPADALRMRDGRLVVCWSNSQKPKHVFNRLVLAMAISSDGGQTWRGYREIARTDGIEGPKGWVCYPQLHQAANGDIIVIYNSNHFIKPMLARVDPDWLEETSFYDDFSEGLDNWITLRTEGVALVAHPNGDDRQVLALRKPNSKTAAGASLNFPFGAQGKLTTRVYLRPGFHGVRLTLTDHFTWPYYAEDGAFSLNIAPDGTLGIGQGEGEYEATDIAIRKSKWYTLTLRWDAEKGDCQLLLDDEPVAQLPELADMLGVCYLRLWSESEYTDEAGMLVESVSVNSQP